MSEAIDWLAVSGKSEMARWWCIAVAVVVVIVAAIYTTLIGLEDSFLLHPTIVNRYKAYDRSETEQARLPNGGLLLRYLGPAGNPKAGGRVVLVLHGNAGNLDGMFGLAHRLWERGYDPYMLEYAGFGACTHDPGSGKTLPPPRTESLVQDTAEAWAVVPPEKRPAGILLGCSMGGGAIAQFLAGCGDGADMPAQVVLMNTYFDLPMLVGDVFPIPGIPSIMRTRWNARPGLDRYFERAPDGELLVVATADDELIPLKHAHLLVTEPHTEAHGNRTPFAKSQRRKLIVLPNGGHNTAIFAHFGTWLPALLPADPRKPASSPPKDLIEAS